MRYPLALGLTLTVEVAVYTAAVLAAGFVRGRRAVAAVAGAAVAANLATHPLVWLALRDAGSTYWPRFAVVEVAAWLAESALLFLVIRRDARLLALVALVANCASALAGIVLWRTT